ncbi:medium chain dehydrogenase/reductase family protein [Streptacidiphilus sp. P02-A3a]|uniref:MDR/zinc-dependent alcohol dehydrogenase-like family protein n=1 Tax=Streptacidiphilus sp. P02-A3a TaxID=2704468 RepID=UPI0015F79CFB|nr:medium chain dehydrogenase/reductase family protein [Streptacidiphilus sp. P02-A3a]QMU71664.1 alcohol dehydrogenase catalytic domain-containing protein [Streptacidiphilus sp. P02-A3a]
MPNLPATYVTTALRGGVVSLGASPFPQDALGDDTVVIKTDHLGICRADTKEILGSRDVMEDRGPLFGHELVGAVAFAGTATGFQEGDLVTLNPNITPTRTTGFAEYVFVHGTKEQLDQAVVRVPEPRLRDGVWMPEPFACIVHALGKLLELTRLPSLRGKRVGIIGAGCAGLMFAMYARHLGAVVAVFNRGEMRSAFARRQGILAEGESHSLADARTPAQQGRFDIVIVAPTIATTELLETAAGLAADGAVLFVYGGTRNGDSFPVGQVNIDALRRQERIESVRYRGKRIRVSGAYGCLRQDYEEGFRLHAEHPHAFPLEKLTSRRISLDEFPGRVMEIAAGAADFPGKVLITISPARTPDR